MLSADIFYFAQKDPIKAPILTLSSALVKICRIPHVIFQASQFFFKFSTTLQFHERELLCTFVVQAIYILVTRSQLKHKFFRHLSARVKICEVPHVNLKRQVRFSSIFASFFIVITHTLSVNFKLRYFLLWTKGSHQSSNFDTFECSGENLPNSSCHFPSNSVFLQIFYHSSIS